MAVQDDYQFDYTGTTSQDAVPTFQHIDGRINYNTNTGTAPALGDYIRGTNSGAVAKIIAGDDLGGTNATGYLDLTNTIGLFEDNDPLEVLASLAFDSIANGGFKVGDALEETGGAGGKITARAVEYNLGNTSGAGVVYGDTVTPGFLAAEVIDITSGVATVASATAAETTPATFTGALADGQLAPPGTASTNNAVIIHYDAGSIDIPDGAIIGETGAAALGKAQRVYGDSSTGSIYVINSDTTASAWTDDISLELKDVIFYDTQVAGKVWQVGDVGRGATSLEEFRVLAVIDDGDSSGKLICAGRSVTAMTNGENLDRLLSDDTYENVAQVENLTDVLAAATLNIPDGVIDTQRASEGGIYGTGSLNIVRDVVEIASYVAGTMDDLGQLDDKSIIDGQVKDVAYTVLDPWKVPHLSWRFAMRGGVQDQSGDEILTNLASSGEMDNVGNHGFYVSTTNPTPQPDLYIEQDGAVVAQSWLKGHINVLVLKRSRRNPAYIDGTVDTLGQNINAGLVTVHNHEYLSTYADADDSTIAASVAPVFLQTKADANNVTGQYTVAYDVGSAATLQVGEEITTGTGNSLKVGIVTAQTGDAGAAGTVAYVLKSATQFADNDSLTGSISGKTLDVDETGGLDSTNDLVAGYGTNIRTMTTQIKITGDGGSGTFVIGEQVTQVTSGATGYILEKDGFDIYLEKANATAFTTGDLTVTGDTSSATLTDATIFVIDTNTITCPKDIGDEVDNDYTAVTGANITNAAKQPVLSVYQWHKFIDRKESTLTIKGSGNSADVEGRFFRKFGTSFSQSGENAHETFAGGKAFTTQGHYIEKDTLSTADLQNIELIDSAGTTENPPNVQALQHVGLFIGVNEAVYRATGAAGAGSEDILTTEFTVGSVTADGRSGDSTILLADGSRTVTPIPKDVPITAVLKIEDPSNPGIFLRFPLASIDRANNRVTLASGTVGNVTNSTNLNAGDDCFIVFHEETASGTSVSANVEFVSDFPIVGIARKKGKKPSTATSDFTSSGGTVSASFNNDPSVNLP